MREVDAMRKGHQQRRDDILAGREERDPRRPPEHEFQLAPEIKSEPFSKAVFLAPHQLSAASLFRRISCTLIYCLGLWRSLEDGQRLEIDRPPLSPIPTQSTVKSHR